MINLRVLCPNVSPYVRNVEVELNMSVYLLKQKIETTFPAYDVQSLCLIFFFFYSMYLSCKWNVFGWRIVV
jgi:hypothetical protein